MTDNLKLATTACAWFAVACLSGQLRAELKPEEIYAAVLPSTLTLEVENGAGKHFVGSAFLAVADGLAVTAWHVIQDAQRVEARFSDNQRVQVSGLVDKNEKLDLALIKLEIGHRPRITLNPALPRIGSRVYVVGAPRGFDFSISDGLLSQIRAVDGVRYYQVSCPISPGDSGGPVLNERGEAIGVMSWRKADAENVSFAIPGSEVTRLNAHGALARWSGGALVSHSSGVQAEGGPLVRADVPVKGQIKKDEFGAFQEFLAGHAGKKLAVIVEEGGKQSRFTFEVPKAPAK